MFYKITNTEDKWYKSFRQIYTISFPIFEQRNEEQQMAAFSNQHYNLLASIDNENLLSFISYWEFDNYIYIEHLAVNPEFRGKSIGSNTLTQFGSNTEKIVLLEIDPPIDEVSINRLRFYKHLDYKPNSYKHSHPAYNPNFEPHKLQILSLHKELDEEVYKQFCSDLENIVMIMPK